MKDVLYVTGEFRRVVVNVNLLRSSHPDKTRDGSYRLLLHTFKHSSKDSHRPFLGNVFEQVLQTCEISAGCEVRMQLRRLRIQSIFSGFSNPEPWLGLAAAGKRYRTTAHTDAPACG